MKPIITVFANSPDQGRGLARDMTVRWALEEVGQPYEVRLVSFADMKQAEHLRRHPFGQIPTYEKGELVLFESGAIVQHIAEQHGGLFPAASDARARTIMWMFAAQSSVEPLVVQCEVAVLLERDKPWHSARMPMLKVRLNARLKELSNSLGDADWLEGEFSAGDLLMIQVLRRPACAELLVNYPNLSDYLLRGEARPAFKRAFAAQLAVFNNQ